MNRKRYLLVILLIIITAVALLAWYSLYTNTFSGIPHNDTMDYASMGRNIAQGQGFLSSYLTPLGLANHEAPQPNLWRAPLWPLTLALFQLFLPSSDLTIILASGIFYAGGAVLIFLLGRCLFNFWVGLASTLIYIFSSLNLNYSLSGLTESQAVFLMTLLVYLLVIPSTKNKAGDFLLGLVLGLFYLSRYNAGVFVPFVAIYWFINRSQTPSPFHKTGPDYKKGALSVARLLIVSFLTILPWLIRNMIVMGSPLFSLQKFEPVMFTQSFPGYSLYMRPEIVDVKSFILAHPDQIWTKITENLAAFRADLIDPQFSGISVFLMIAFLVSLLVPFNKIGRFNKKLSGIRIFYLACLLTQLAALLVIHYIPRLFLTFLPFYIIYGTALIYCLLAIMMPKIFSFKIWRRQMFIFKIIGFFIFIAAILFLVADNQPNWSKDYAWPNNLYAKYREPITEIAGLVNENQYTVSNDGHLLAWYVNRPAIKIPVTLEMLDVLEEKADIQAIFLSSRLLLNTPEVSNDWVNIFRERPQSFKNYLLHQVYPDGSLIYLKKT